MFQVCETPLRLGRSSIRSQVPVVWIPPAAFPALPSTQQQWCCSRTVILSKCVWVRCCWMAVGTPFGPKSKAKTSVSSVSTLVSLSPRGSTVPAAVIKPNVIAVGRNPPPIQGDGGPFWSLTWSGLELGPSLSNKPRGLFIRLCPTQVLFLPRGGRNKTLCFASTAFPFSPTLWRTSCSSFNCISVFPLVAVPAARMLLLSDTPYLTRWEESFALTTLFPLSFVL